MRLWVCVVWCGVRASERAGERLGGFCVRACDARRWTDNKWMGESEYEGESESESESGSESSGNGNPSYAHALAHTIQIPW